MSNPVLSYSQITPGMVIDSKTVTITAAMIDAFVALSGDDFEIHLTDEAAIERGYKARVAHGLLGLAVTDGLRNHAEKKFDAIASLHWDWTFAAPIYVGDTLSAQTEVLEKRVTSDGSRGILIAQISLTNQDGEIVQRGTNTLMVRATD